MEQATKLNENIEDLRGELEEQIKQRKRERADLVLPLSINLYIDDRDGLSCLKN
jgi:hypothetical protein